jgi:V8-like Glu-specific endopeptidase
MSDEMTDGCHKWIGALTFQVQKGQFGTGTAVLISKNLILTAAHNVYDRKYQIFHTKFKFYLAACGVVEDYY